MCFKITLVEDGLTFTTNWLGMQACTVGWLALKEQLHENVGKPNFPNYFNKFGIVLTW